jgi:sugar/nucleoside kinase (ribokinase family)
VALARLGTPARFLTRWSGDVFGRLFRAHLRVSGVDLPSAVQAAEPSTPAVAELGVEGQAAFSFPARNTADRQWTAEELAWWTCPKRLACTRDPSPWSGSRRGGGGGLPGVGRGSS